MRLLFLMFVTSVSVLFLLASTIFFNLLPELPYKCFMFTAILRIRNMKPHDLTLILSLGCLCCETTARFSW